MTLGRDRGVERPGLPLGASLLLGVSLAVFGLSLTVAGLRTFGFGVDSLAYWTAWHRPEVYSSVGTRVSFNYSPAFAHAIWPLAQLPWPVFAALWAGLTLTALLWLLWPLSWPWRLALLALLAPELIVGNVWALYAVVVVIGFRHPEAWALPLLTKGTAGLGLLWFAVRREWRKLAVAVAATVAVALVSFLIEPGLWRSWASYLWRYRASNDSYPPETVRLPIACLMVVAGALRSRPGWLALAVALASPVFGTDNFVVLAALPRLGGWAALAGRRERMTEPDGLAEELALERAAEAEAVAEADRLWSRGLWAQAHREGEAGQEARARADELERAQEGTNERRPS